MDQTYREALARARDPEAKSALAKRLLKAAADEEKHETKYAVLNKAIPIAVQAGDAPTASALVDKLDESWQIDAAKLRAETLVKTVRFLRTPEDQIAFVHLAQPFIEKDIADKKFDAAKSLSDAAAGAAQRGNDAALAKEMTARGAEIVERRTAESRVTLAMNTLKTKPDDLAANTAVGRYECYIEDQWPEGLAKLSHGNDVALKALAAKDLAEDGAPESKVAAADAWWDLARREGEFSRRHIQLHAVALYKDALPKLTGVAKQKVDKRLAEVADAAAPKSVAPPPTVAASDAPRVTVRNLSRATEAQPVIDGVAHDFPDILKGFTQATLLYYRDASQLAHGEGGSRPLQGAYSTSPSISTATNFLFYGLSDPFKPGKYLVVYRVQLMSVFNSANAATVFQTDVYSEGNAIGRRQVKGSDAPMGEWKNIPMIVTVPAATTGEYRIYGGQKRTVALDRVYVYGIQ